MMSFSMDLDEMAEAQRRRGSAGPRKNKRASNAKARAIQLAEPDYQDALDTIDSDSVEVDLVGFGDSRSCDDLRSFDGSDDGDLLGDIPIMMTNMAGKKLTFPTDIDDDQRALKSDIETFEDEDARIAPHRLNITEGVFNVNSNTMNEVDLEGSLAKLETEVGYRPSRFQRDKTKTKSERGSLLRFFSVSMFRAETQKAAAKKMGSSSSKLVDNPDLLRGVREQQRRYLCITLALLTLVFLGAVIDIMFFNKTTTTTTPPVVASLVGDGEAIAQEKANYNNKNKNNNNNESGLVFFSSNNNNENKAKGNSTGYLASAKSAVVNFLSPTPKAKEVKEEEKLPSIQDIIKTCSGKTTKSFDRDTLPPKVVEQHQKIAQSLRIEQAIGEDNVSSCIEQNLAVLFLTLDIISHDKEQHNSAAYSRQREISRYALAVFYLKLNGQHWLRNNHWLVWDQHECDWAGVDCSDDKESVTGLLLAENSLQGSLPDEIGLLSELQIIHVSFNGITGKIPHAIGQMKGLTQFMVTSNGMEGILPDELFLLPSLSILQLDNNHFVGPIPTAIGELRESLNKLTLGNNNFTGSLPVELWHNQNLRSLDISNLDSISRGHISPTVGRLHGLKSLVASNCGLGGHLPIELTHCLSLSHLDVSQNRLRGSIPEELAKLRALKVLKMNGNNFNEDVPDEVCDMEIFVSTFEVDQCTPSSF